MRKTIAAVCAGLATACGTAPPPAPQPPQDDSALNARAVQLAAHGDALRAIALWEPLLRRQPSAALYGNLGYAYYLAGRMEQAQWALEKACVLEPGNPQAWERLAALLETMGQGVRALDAMRQARELRERAAVVPPAVPPQQDLWPADMARTEVRQVGGGLVEVLRVPAALAVPAQPMQGVARLEISNGNGVRGLAAAWAQRLREQGLQVVRLTNTRPFNVRRTRVEVADSGATLLPSVAARLGVDVVPGRLAPAARSEVRVVLGADLAPDKKKPPALGRRQAP